MTAEAFVADLARLRLASVFNPYSEKCSIHDRAGSARQRRENLAAVLRTAWGRRGGSVWIARDLGYRGGRRTGLPLTDEVHLASFSAAWGGVPLHKATAGPVVAERTATIIWDMLSRVQQPVFLWNLFPLHPHEAEDPMSNRAHTASERQVGAVFLLRLLDALRPETVVAIGGDAAAALVRSGVTHVKVRHPSYGGQADFCRGIRAAYGLPLQETPMLPPARLL